MVRQDISITGTVADLAVTMCEGNPGGLRVLVEILKEDPEHGFMRLLDLDDMNIRGHQIWVGYKDFAKEDLQGFLVAVKARDPAMVEVINNECIYGSFQEKAVTHGGSFRRR